MHTIHEEKPKDRSPWRAMWRGALMRCPQCNAGKLFRRYLKVADACPHCGEELHHHRADDAPAYLTIFLVGHILVPPIMLIERFYAPALWLQFVVWAPLLFLLTLGILPLVKGAVVGLQWALRMHGFEGAPTAQKPLDSST
ncbi:MAG: DUF983 domain-containing protein [Alphaproteobacteria bacterium]|nr:DUF983 domain-containing protein [Alphaproteobacteria bacterium]